MNTHNSFNVNIISVITEGSIDITDFAGFYQLQHHINNKLIHSSVEGF